MVSLSATDFQPDMLSEDRREERWLEAIGGIVPSVCVCVCSFVCLFVFWLRIFAPHCLPRSLNKIWWKGGGRVTLHRTCILSRK